jgi:hypothetical protein
MKADNTSNQPTTLPGAQPDDLLAEGERARRLSADLEGMKSLVEGIRLVNDTVFAHVLFALWDSGFYEFSLTHPRFQVQEAAEQLHLDATLLPWVLNYLVGRRILRAADGQMELTENGIRLSNILLRGTMNVYLGGYGALLANIGPLLRKEITRTDLEKLRSGHHTGMGTEQLTSIRIVPAVLKILEQRKLNRLLHLACGAGGFLIQLARSEPSLRGIGIDKSAQKIAAAQESASRLGLDSRLGFVNAEIGIDPLPLDDESRGAIDVITSIYLLHEIGRHGRQRIVEVLRQVQKSFPGRLFIFTETLPSGTPATSKKPPETFSQLDYALIHRIRGKGLPLPPAEWKAIVEDAGLRLIEFKELFWIGLYLVEL